MIDIAYVLGSILFFALMIAYVEACNRLGRRSERESMTTADRRP